MAGIIQQLTDELGPDGVVGTEQLLERAASYWDSSPTEAKCLLRPQSTKQLSTLMRICHENGQSVVVQGGLTGIVEGALSTANDIIISLERMNEIESVDVLDGVAVIQAGAVLQTVQEQLAERGFLFPLDFGARGSATIGGATATNAGGLNVLRYGMMRNLVMGLEAVLADGTVISSMNTMLKNNTGYDLKQLFIGSEGTLGIVTRVVVKLYPLTTSRQTAMLAMNSFDAVVRLLQSMRTGLAGTLSAYEVMWNNYFTAVTGEGAHVAPLAPDHPFYVLAEAEGSEPEADEERFQRLLEQVHESGDIVDAVVPKSETERDALWAIREQFEAAQPAYLYDVSLPMKAMSSYVEKLEVELKAWRPDAECNVFGHIADGNLHIFVKPFDDGAHHAASDKIVYGCLDGLGGSISAEHGIGIEKKHWLGETRSSAEIEMMRSLKAMMDPKNLLNPGKVVD
jgi:FAD/FMN-containing dehydrogenase